MMKILRDDKHALLAWNDGVLKDMKGKQDAVKA